MAEWAQHSETVNGPVITAVYTGFCFSNLDIHKSLCFLHHSYIGSCVASNEVLTDVGRDYSNCGTIGEAGSLKMKWVPIAPLLSSYVQYMTRKLLFCILCVKRHSISSAAFKSCLLQLYQGVKSSVCVSVCVYHVTLDNFLGIQCKWAVCSKLFHSIISLKLCKVKNLEDTADIGFISQNSS